MWHMDKEQWNLLRTGEQAFWKAMPRLVASGHYTAEGITEPRRSSTGQPYKIPRLMAAQDGECIQTMRTLLSRGIAGIDERTRGLTQRWFVMVDWRSANVGSAQLGVNDEGWWYPVRSVIWCRECRRCITGSEKRALVLRGKNGRKSSRPRVCAQCVIVQKEGLTSTVGNGKANKGEKNVNNRKARRPRADHCREKDPETRIRSGICESCGTLGTVEGKRNLQSFYILRANDKKKCCLLVLNSVASPPRWKCTEVDRSWTIMSSTYNECCERYNLYSQQPSYKESRQ